MSLKLFRVFSPGLYAPNFQLMNELKVAIIPRVKAIIPVLTEDQGIARVEGVVRKKGTGLSGYTVKLFKTQNNTVLYSTLTDSDGIYKFKNIRKGMECYLVAFPSDADRPTTNARIKTQIIAE